MPRPSKLKDRATFLAASTPYYVMTRVDLHAVHGVQFIWHDGTSNFTVTAYSSLLEDPDEPSTGDAAPNLEHWHDESADVSITGAAASAAGCDIIHLGNIGATWMLFKFDVTADSVVTIYKKQRN